MPSLETYDRVGWQDLPSTETPLSAENLNHMDNAIYLINQDVATIEDRLDNLSTSDASEYTVTFDDDPSSGDLVTSPDSLANIVTGIYSRVIYLINAVDTFALKSDLDTTVGNFALVEQNVLASSNYDVGDYLIKNNILYRVIQAIEAGSQFTNENIVETTVGDEIKSISSSGSGDMASYPGMIIHSTTLTTEAEVINKYGGTEWILHDGYFLRGGNQTNVTPYATGSTGGSTTHNHGGSVGSTTLTAAQCALPSHYHSPQGSDRQFQLRPKNDNTNTDAGSALSGSGYKYPRSLSSASGWAGETHTGATSIASASSSHTHSISSANHLPPFRNVYIWERIT